MMKRILLTVFTIFMLAVPCSYGASLLSEVVNIMNNECPEDLGDGMSITNVYEKGNDIIIRIEMSDDQQGIISVMNQYPELMKEVVATMVNSLKSEEGTEMLIYLIIEENKNLTFEFVNSVTGEKAQLTLTPRDLAS